MPLSGGGPPSSAVPERAFRLRKFTRNPLNLSESTRSAIIPPGSFRIRFFRKTPGAGVGQTYRKIPVAENETASNRGTDSC
jgi:hypothetical protein